MGLKHCSTCRLSLDPSEFYMGRRGKLRASCKPCYRLAGRNLYASNPEKRRASQKEWVMRNPEAERSRRKSYNAKNKERIRKYHANRYLARKSEILARNRRWATENRERRKQYESAWARENRDRLLAKSAARRALKLNATPGWANKEKIFAIYAESRRITAETGIPHEVDHIIPLKGDGVVGLHVESNLRVIPRSENRRTGKKFAGATNV